MKPIGFYVYGIKRGESLIYIGKGTGSRVHTSMRKHGGTSYVIFADDLSESDAFHHEKIIIRAMRNCGVLLDNIH